MKHKNGFNPLSRTSAHRRALHRNMVTSLFKYERITTTKQKAMEIRRTAEKLITRAKVDSVHNRRQAATYIWDEAILNKLFTEGDAAQVAILELVDYTLDKSTKKSADAKKDGADKGAAKSKAAEG